MNVYIKLKSRNFKIWKILNVWKLLNQKLSKTFSDFFPNFQKPKKMKETCHLYKCIKLQVHILKNDRVLVF